MSRALVICPPLSPPLEPISLHLKVAQAQFNSFHLDGFLIPLQYFPFVRSRSRSYSRLFDRHPMDDNKLSLDTSFRL